MDFVKVRRRISYSERMFKLNKMLNESPNREVSIRDLVQTWNLSPNYVRRLMRWADLHYDHIEFDENYGCLFFKSEVNPTCTAARAQTKLDFGAST